MTGCMQVGEAQNTEEFKTENSFVKEESDEIKAIPTDANYISLAAKALNEYFDISIDPLLSEEAEIVDMTEFVVVFFENAASVRMSKESFEVFNIKQYFSDYEMSSLPIDEEESFALANQWIEGNEELSKLNLEKIDFFFEFQFDTQIKEYFIFEYQMNEENQSRIFIKVNTFSAQVCEITLNINRK